MKHVFRTNEVKQINHEGLQFKPSNALGYSILSKWPNNIKANEVKLYLNKRFGLTIYLIDKKGNLLEEVNPLVLIH